MAVLLKPEHGQKILREQQGVGFSPKAAYIFLKQIEEADIAVINKIDKLSPPECEELVRLVSRRFPGKEVLRASARTGVGFDALIRSLERPASKRAPHIHVDYDVYAEGEAELGWLNAALQVERRGEQPFELDNLLTKLVTRLKQLLLDRGAEPAHLKVLGQADGQSGMANLVGSEADVELSAPSGAVTRAADLIINARVAIRPADLETTVEQAFGDVAAALGLHHAVRNMQCFQPGRPTPTHRLTRVEPATPENDE
jgi:hypothetical protein